MTTYNNGSWGGQQNIWQQQPQQQTQQEVQTQPEGRELGWNDEIVKDAEEYILLEPGEYQFTVASFERGRYGGSSKMSPCNTAMLTLRVQTDKADCGFVNVRHTLFLHSKFESTLSAFFTSIGQKKKGQPLKMNWNTVIGSVGKCRIDTKEYNGNKYNEVKKFIIDDLPF